LVLRSAVGTLALLVLVALVMLVLNDVGIISLAYIQSRLTYFIRPVEIGLGATMVSFVIGFTIGIPMGVVRAFGPGIIRRRGSSAVIMAPIYGFVSSYVQAIRGTPVFVQILLIVAVVERLVAPGTLGIEFWGGVVALSVNTIGYQAEVFRAGFQSVGQGQVEAAKSIGMTPTQTFAHVTLPQGLRLIILPLTNEWISLFKASALLWYVAVQEIMWAGYHLEYIDAKPIEAFLMVSFWYLIIMIPLSKVISYVEKTKRIPGLGTPVEPTRRRLLGGRVRTESANSAR
jgi:polar amino acid transport system permease protein